MGKNVIMKFGGTSVGSVEAFEQSTSIIKNKTTSWDSVVVIVSAMSGITNLLLNCAKAAEMNDTKTYEAIIEEIRQKHFNVLTTMLHQNIEQKQLETEINTLLDELSAICTSIQIMKEVTPRGLDIIVSLGERINARVFSALLRTKGLKSLPIEATKLIVTNKTFQNAMPLMDKTRKKTQEELEPLLEDGYIPVITGFIGATEDGILTTLGRGGSDFSATIIGSCLDVDEVWTWTDVDGVMSADPRVVKNTKIISELSFVEVGEMAYFGAKVLHPKTILPIIEQNIPLWVKNTFNPDLPGTRISKQTSLKSGKATAISVIHDLSIITIAGRGMMGVTGIAARTFSAVARENSNVVMISQSSSEQSICFIVPKENAKNVVATLQEEFNRELERNDITAITERSDISVLSVIGGGMRETPGVAGEIFSALGEAKINVITIAQGSSEYSISFALDAKQANAAMKKVHERIIENGHY